MKNYIHAIYDDDEKLIKAVKEIRKRGVKIKDVYTPFPVHGLDSVLGLRRTRLGITSFIYGMMGLGLAILMTNYMMITDWPQDIGGKPSQSWFTNMPSFVPIMFELSVFCAAHLMVGTYFFRSKLYPTAKPTNPDIRTTDDKFLVEIALEDNKEVADIETILRATNPFEINTK